MGSEDARARLHSQTRALYPVVPSQAEQKIQQKHASIVGRPKPINTLLTVSHSHNMIDCIDSERLMD